MNSSAVPIDIYKSPEGRPRVYSRKEQTLILSIDAEVNIASGVHVVVQYVVFLAESFAQSLGPVARFVGEVRAGVFGERMGEGRGVVGGEAKADDAAPAVGDLDEAKADLLINSNRPGAERDALAEALHTPRDGAISRDPDVLPVDAVEAQRWEVVGGAAGAGGAGRWYSTAALPHFSTLPRRT